ncbi:hypothetical protein ACFLZG_03000, partial [Thermodesulfobacteriota bacterium]
YRLGGENMKCMKFRSLCARFSVLSISIFLIMFLCQCHHGHVTIGTEPRNGTYPHKGDKEEQKYHKKRDREVRKFYEKQDREARKFHEKQERESRSHKKQDHKARKFYEKQDREVRKFYEKQDREARKFYEKQEKKASKYLEKHKRYEYHYYPSTGVYFDVNRKIYFYFVNGRWQISVTLPGGTRLGYDDPVTINMNNYRPYMKYHEHKQKYRKHK